MSRAVKLFYILHFYTHKKVVYSFNSFYFSVFKNSFKLFSKMLQLLFTNVSINFRYYSANFVGNSPTIETCDVSCIHMYYCAATKLDHEDYDNCAKTHASAFSASTSSAFPQLPASAAFISFYGPIILAFTIYRVR